MLFKVYFHNLAAFWPPAVIQLVEQLTDNHKSVGNIFDVWNVTIGKLNVD